MGKLLPLLILAVSAAIASDPASREQLIGAWQSGADSDGSGVWTIESGDGDSLRLIHSADGKELIRFECTPDGQECQLRDSGKKAKISMWFNGNTLVVLEVRDDTVTEHHFSPSNGGAGLEVSVSSVKPAGKTESSRYRRKTS